MHEGLFVTDWYRAEPLNSVPPNISGAGADASAFRRVGFRSFGGVPNRRGLSAPYFYHQQEGTVLEAIKGKIRCFCCGHAPAALPSSGGKKKADAMLARLSQLSVPFDKWHSSKVPVVCFLL